MWAAIKQLKVVLLFRRAASDWRANNFLQAQLLYRRAMVNDKPEAESKLDRCRVVTRSDLGGAQVR
jgi:hypothetical protein